MDKIDNPYAPGMGSRPPYLAGREQQSALVDVLFARLAAGATGDHPMFYGLRGVGKTVLLLEAEEKARARGWPAAMFEGEPDQSILPRVAAECRSVANQLSAPKLSELARAALEAVQAFTLAVGPLSATVNKRPSASSIDISGEVVKLVVAIGHAAHEAARGVVLLFDELHLVPRNELRAVLTALHRANQLALPVAILGAGLPQLPTVLQEAKTYAERAACYPVAALDHLAAQASLVNPALAKGVQWEDSAVDSAIDFTGGYPYFLQLIGQHAWNAAPERTNVIRAADVRGVIPRVQQQLDQGFFRGRYDRATVAEKRYLAALARITAVPGADEAGSATVAKAAGYKDLAAASPTRQSLISKGLVYATNRGMVAFTVPHFGNYILRRQSVDRPEETHGSR